MYWILSILVKQITLQKINLQQDVRSAHCVLVSTLHCRQNQWMQPTLAILTALTDFGLKQYIYKAVSFCFTLSH